MEELDSKKVYLFEQMPVSKAVMKLSIPTVLGSMVMVLYSLADTYFVGLVNDPLETAAVSLAAPIILAFNAITNLFGTGCSSVMSRALGVKDLDTFRKTSSFGFYMGIICASLFSLVFTIFKGSFLNVLGASPENVTQTSQYLFWTVTCGAIPSILNVIMSNLVRSEGSALHASIGVMSGCALNIVIDPIFILPSGLGMGSAGAGCATFISNCVACIYFFILLIVKKKKTYVTINIKYFKPNKKVIAGVFSIGIPASIQNLLNVTGMTVLNNLAAVYGSEAVAAAGISHKLAMVPLYFSMGIGQGVMPLAGYTYSAKLPERLKKAIQYTTRAAILFMVAASAAFFIFSSQLIGVFIGDELTVEYGSAFLKGMSLAQPFLCMDFIAVSVFQACGFGGRSLIFAVIRKIVLEIPALLILDKLFPMYGIAYAQLVAEVILAIAAVICLVRIVKRAYADASTSRAEKVEIGK